MGKIILIWRLYAARIWKEVFLMMQIFSLIIFFEASFYPFKKCIRLSRDMEACFKFDTDRILHFDPYAGIEETGEVERQYQNTAFENVVKKCEKYVEKIGMISELRADIIQDAETSQIANLIVYSKDLYEITDLKLKEGEFVDKNKNGDEIVPVVVAGKLAKEHSIGDHVLMDVSLNGEKECKIETVITGILNEEKPIITIHYGGTTRQLDTIGFYPEDMEGYSFVLAVENEKFSQIKWNYPMLFQVKEKLSVKEAIEEMTKILSEYGTVNKYKTLRQQSWYWTSMEHQWEILLCILFIPVLMFGFGGYLFIHLIQTRERMAIFYLMGISRKKIFVLYSAATELVIAIPVLAAMYTTNPIIKNIYSINNQAKFSVGTFLFFFVFSMVAFAVNASMFMKKSSNAVILISREGVE